MTAWRCDFPTCGHVWYTAKEPVRCSKCKRKNWNKTGGEVIKAPKTRKKRPPAKQESTPPGHITKGDVMEDLGLTKEVIEIPMSHLEIIADFHPMDKDDYLVTSPAPEPILPTIVHAPTAERFQEALKQIAEPEHKIGEKCKHGWANWLQCDKCNPKVNQ